MSVMINLKFTDFEISASNFSNAIKESADRVHDDSRNFFHAYLFNLLITQVPVKSISHQRNVIDEVEHIE